MRVERLRRMSNLTPQEVITWLRSQAKKLIEAANTVEEGFSFGGNIPMVSQKNGALKGKVTPEMIRERLRKGSSRVPHLAKEFGVPEQVLRKIVKDKKNGIVTQDRGWLKLKKNLNGGKK
jgi:hypothetical protein